MRTLSLLLLLAVVALGSGCERTDSPSTSATTAVSSSRDAPPEDLAEKLVSQNESARKALSPLSYKVAYEYTRPIGGQTGSVTASGIVVEDGDSRWTEGTCTVRIGTDEPTTTRSRTTVNPGYVAVWPFVGMANAYKYDHASPTEMSKEAHDMLVGHQVADYLLYAFGDGEHTVRWNLQYMPADIRWTVTEAKDETGVSVYHLNSFTPMIKDPTKPTKVFTIDPRKGFLITHLQVYDKSRPSGLTTYLFQDATITVEPKGADKIWCPVAIDSKWFTASDTVALHLVRHLKATISDIVVKPVLEEKQFDLASLKLGDQTTIIYTSRTGEAGAIVGGKQVELVPQELPR